MAAPPTLLVVDDEPDVLEALSRYLAQGVPGARVLEAPDGPRALELLAQEDVDLVLSDHRMPGMDGVELLRRVRSEAPRAVRILITGYAELDLAIQAANEAQVHLFLCKPMDPAKVREAVRDLLRAQRRGMLRERAFQRAVDLVRPRTDQPGF